MARYMKELDQAIKSKPFKASTPVMKRR